MLLRGHEDATERGTSSWKQHYCLLVFFFPPPPTNSGKCRGVSKEENCGVKNGGCSKQINQSSNTVILKRNCAIFSELSVT